MAIKKHELANQPWDAVVIGTGMGGAACGYELAKAGKKVLFLEKGKSHLSGSDSLTGSYAEEYWGIFEKDEQQKSNILKKAGRWFTPIVDTTEQKISSRFFPFAGVGSGGSSTLYGMVMQRFSPDDFTPSVNYKNAEGACLPEQWPIQYSDLRQYYKKVEALFEARGELDPLRKDYLDPIAARAPIAEDDFSGELYQHFQQQGLNPYQPPIACDFVEGCLNCQGFICPKNCKNDSAKIFLQPALAEFSAELLDECQVLKLEAEKDRVTSIVCQWRDQEIVINGDLIILAAGALETPNILAHSTSTDWPQGLANQSGMVGKNLMRNLYDLYFVFAKRKVGHDGPKELYLTDFYTPEAGKLGIIQSFGFLSPKSTIEGMENDIQYSSVSFLLPIFKVFKPLTLLFIKLMFSRMFILVTTSEDMPYEDNQIFPSEQPGGSIAFRYKARKFDLDRISRLRNHMKTILKPYRAFLMKQADQNKNFIALACGTCRFGDDPKTSVCDADNKAHGLENLYIVDASFFPSNPGLNSGLTVAANALRVADKILGRS